jgi:hypothetical protein
MAPFTNAREDWQRLDWQILRDGGITLYCRPKYLAEDVQWLASRNYAIYNFDCAKWRSDDELYSDFASVLRLSEWWGRDWGRNLDALDDCLSDLPIRDDGGAALVLRRFDAYARGCGAALVSSGGSRADALLDIVVRASRLFLLTGKRLLTLVQTDDRQFKLPSLGVVSPVWNRREWPSGNGQLTS